MSQKIDTNHPQPLSITMQDEFVPRRTVLKHALAVGCGLFAPSFLIGCDSKPSDGATGAAPPGTAETAETDAAAPAAPVARNTVPQASVQYQNQPKGEQQCSECVHFIAESNSCVLVEGQISPEAWCTLWAPRV